MSTWILKGAISGAIRNISDAETLRQRSCSRWTKKFICCSFCFENCCNFTKFILQYEKEQSERGTDNETMEEISSFGSTNGTFMFSQRICRPVGGRGCYMEIPSGRRQLCSRRLAVD